MRIRMTVDAATPMGKLSRGECYEVEDQLALSYCKIRWAVPAPQEVEQAIAYRHVGGGWYELGDGRKVRGKAALEEALEDA